MSVPLWGELRRRRVFLSYVVVALATGFPIVVTLAWIFDVKAGRIERTVSTPAAGPKGVRLGFVLVGIGLLAAAPGVVWYFVVRSPARSVSAPGAGTHAVMPSIAVLPFADVSPGKDQDYFSDGIAEEILDNLAQVEGLRVIGRTSSFSFKGKSDDLRTIGEKLNVMTVLAGSVRRVGDRVRITAQLNDVQNGYQLWSERYDRELKDIFDIQDEIAKSIAERLRVTLAGIKDNRLVAQATTNMEAYQLCLKGRALLDRRGASVPASLDLLRRAVEFDPGYSLAWAGSRK